MSYAAAFLPEFESEMATTRKHLERVPEDKFGWKPHAKSMELGKLAMHLAQMPGWSKETMTKNELDVAPKDGPKFELTSPKSRQEILDMFDKNVAVAKDVIGAAAEPDFGKPWSLLAGGQTIFTMPKAGVLRSMVMNHVIHHRAQLGVYLRLLDVPVPRSYGPSADEGMM